MNNNLVFFLTSTPTFPKARCADPGIDPELFFPISNEVMSEDLPILRAICDSCVHQAECAKYAIDNHEAHGIWGGTTPAQRERIWKETNSNKESSRRTRVLTLAEQAYTLRSQGWSWESIASRIGVSSEYAERLSYRHKKIIGDRA